MNGDEATAGLIAATLMDGCSSALVGRHAVTMPELSELQAHAERLDRAFAGSDLKRFDWVVPSVRKTATPTPDAAYRHPVAFVGRRGKYLLIDFGVVTFVVDLARTGRLGVDESRIARTRAGLARWRFRDGRVLVLTEADVERRAGVWVVAGDPEQQAPLDQLGPDANDVSPGRLFALFHAHPMTLDAFLREQQVIAGLGPRLATEVPHRAKLSPSAATLDLTAEDAERLVEAIHACVNEDLAHERGRTDMRDPDERPQ